MSLKPDAEGTLTANGSEQTLTNITALTKLSGYVDLSQMQLGDSVVIRQYMVLKSGGSDRKYEEHAYSGAQDPPVVYVTTKVLAHGGKVTLQQTAGAYRTYDYSFVREE